MIQFQYMLKNVDIYYFKHIQFKYTSLKVFKTCWGHVSQTKGALHSKILITFLKYAHLFSVTIPKGSVKLTMDKKLTKICF